MTTIARGSAAFPEIGQPHSNVCRRSWLAMLSNPDTRAFQKSGYLQSTSVTAFSSCAIPPNNGDSVQSAKAYPLPFEIHRVFQMNTVLGFHVKYFGKQPLMCSGANLRCRLRGYAHIFLCTQHLRMRPRSVCDTILKR